MLTAMTAPGALASATMSSTMRCVSAVGNANRPTVVEVASMVVEAPAVDVVVGAVVVGAVMTDDVVGAVVTDDVVGAVVTHEVLAVLVHATSIRAHPRPMAERWRDMTDRCRGAALSCGARG